MPAAADNPQIQILAQTLALRSKVGYYPASRKPPEPVYKNDLCQNRGGENDLS